MIRHSQGCNRTGSCWGSVVNNCGGGGGGGEDVVIAFPNPVSNQLTLAIAQTGTSTSNADSTSVATTASVPNLSINGQLVDQNAEFQAKLYDQNSHMVMSGQSQNGVLIFSVGDLPNGLYYLNMMVGSAMLSEHILVSK